MPVGSHFSRIESHDTCPGFPDVDYTYQQKSGTIELKCNPFPVGDFPFQGEKHGLRKAQHLWIRDELTAGGRVILCLQAEETIFFLEGKYHDMLDSMNLERLTKAASLIWTRKGRNDTHQLAGLLRSPL